MTALDKAGTGSIEPEDFNSLVDAVAGLQEAVAEYVDPSSMSFESDLVASLQAAGLMRPTPE